MLRIIKKIHWNSRITLEVIRSCHLIDISMYLSNWNDKLSHFGKMKRRKILQSSILLEIIYKLQGSMFILHWSGNFERKMYSLLKISSSIIPLLFTYSIVVSIHVFANTMRGQDIDAILPFYQFWRHSSKKEWHYSHTLRINNTSSLLYFLQGQKIVLSSSREADIDDLDMFFGIVH